MGPIALLSADESRPSCGGLYSECTFRPQPSSKMKGRSSTSAQVVTFLFNRRDVLAETDGAVYHTE